VPFWFALWMIPFSIIIGFNSSVIYLCSWWNISWFVLNTLDFKVPYNMMWQLTTNWHCITSRFKFINSLPPCYPAIIWIYHCYDTIKVWAGTSHHKFSVILYVKEFLTVVTSISFKLINCLNHRADKTSSKAS